MIIQNAEGVLTPPTEGRTDGRGRTDGPPRHVLSGYCALMHVRCAPYSCKNARKAQRTRSWTDLLGNDDDSTDAAWKQRKEGRKEAKEV